MEAYHVYVLGLGVKFPGGYGDEYNVACAYVGPSSYAEFGIGMSALVVCL